MNHGVDDLAAGPAAGSAGRPRQVVILSAAFPFPSDGGNKVVLAGLVRYFADRYGAENVHYVLVGDQPPEPWAAATVHVVARPTLAERVRSVLGRTVLGPYSLQESVLWSPTTHRAISEVLDSLSPDLVVTDTIRMAQYRSAIPASAETVCHLDDLYSERYRNQRTLAREEPDLPLSPLASFSGLVPAALRWITEWRPSQRALLGFEADRVARSEERAAHEFDRCLLLNRHEAARLQARAPGADVRTIAPLSQSADRRPSERTYTGGPRFLMMGVLSAPHNDLALRWLLTEVLPRARRIQPDVAIDVVGRSASPELLELAARAGDGVVMHDFVPDPSALLAGCAGLLNPPRFPSGIKLKVLDALAAGTPVVSTSAGVDGLCCGDGVLVADTAEEFVAAMTSLQDPAVNARASAAALAAHRATFSPGAVFDRYDDAFRPRGAVHVAPQLPRTG